VQPVYGKSPKKTMDMFLEGMQFDPRQLDLDDDERQQLEAAAAQPDPKVEVEQIRAQSDQAIAQLDNEVEWKKALLSFQAKGMSLDEALEAVETQVAGSITLEQMKQEGKTQEQVVDASLNPEAPSPEMQEPPQEQEQELGVEDSLKILGLTPNEPNEPV